jgi:hypothetical protein
MALKALAFDEGLDVAGEVNFLGNTSRIEAILCIVVRIAFTGGAVGEKNGGREGQGGEDEGPSAHRKIMLQHVIKASVVCRIVRVSCQDFPPNFGE